jgi:hypothetical protein
MPLTADSAARKDQTSAAGATLQHRHFAFIAATLLSVKPAPGNYPNAQDFRDQWNDTVKAFGEACAVTNSKFDRSRFYAACGADPGNWRM